MTISVTPDPTKATQMRTASLGNHFEKTLCAQAAPELETRPRSDGPATKVKKIPISRDNGLVTLINAFTCEPAAPDVHT